MRKMNEEEKELKGGRENVLLFNFSFSRTNFPQLPHTRTKKR